VTGEPARHAADAAEAIRALNHATLPGKTTLAWPADAYETLGQLALAAARLPQALAQIHTFLTEQAAAGRIAIVAGDHAGDPPGALAAATRDLGDAAAAARRLHQALDGAQNDLTWAASTE
jgi:hypothetical protein